MSEGDLPGLQTGHQPGQVILDFNAHGLYQVKELDDSGLLRSAMSLGNSQDLNPQPSTKIVFLDE